MRKRWSIHRRPHDVAIAYRGKEVALMINDGVANHLETAEGIVATLNIAEELRAIVKRRRERNAGTYTLANVKRDLVEIERQLAARLGLEWPVANIREIIIKRARTGDLVEDELVAQWHELYAWYKDFMTAGPRR